MGKMGLYTYQMEKLKDLAPQDAAYIAGFLDADGSIMIQKANHGYRLCVNFSNRNHAVMQWIENRIGGYGILREQRNDLKNTNWSCAYHLTLTILVAEWLLRQVEPYLIVKRQQALLALRFCELKKMTRAGGKKGMIAYRKIEPEFVEIHSQVTHLNRKAIPYSDTQKEAGELQERPNREAVVNLQPSRQKVLEFGVRRKVQRLTLEDSTPNKRDTSAGHESEDIVRAYRKL